MLTYVLAHFPSDTHALTLVSDPDDLLVDESVMTALRARGFRLIRDPDPCALRLAYAQARPITVEHPLIVATGGPLDALPYDLWQRGHHVELALHRLLPTLDYPTVRQLTLQQRRRLAAAFDQNPAPQPLSTGATIRYVLLHVFGCDLAQIHQPVQLLRWLADLYGSGDGLPALFAKTVADELCLRPAFAGLPLAELLAGADAFHAVVQVAWDAFVQARLHEGPAAYASSPLFAQPDDALHDLLPKLVRSGALAPIRVDQQASFPAWAEVAVVYDVAAARARQLGAGLDDIAAQVSQSPLRWADWQVLARRWGQLTGWRYDASEPLPADLQVRYASVQAALNQAFQAWLQPAYGTLAGQRLPEPHHLFHIPGFLAQRTTAGSRIALLILDGMSVAAWQQIKPIWQLRHTHWRFDERLLLAQVPTITAVSRQALISGLPPSRFASSLTHNRREAALWQEFWTARGFDARTIAYANLPGQASLPIPAALDSPYTRALCLIVRDIDDRVHSATQGMAELHASLDVWLSTLDAGRASGWVEHLIQRLLEQGYLVALASDHGHVEASGIGIPQEGVTVESRTKRARIYDREHFARSVQAQFPHSILWHDDGLLPDDRWILMAGGQDAFASEGQWVVSHGGLSIEEMVVPLVLITR